MNLPFKLTKKQIRTYNSFCWWVAMNASFFVGLFTNLVIWSVMLLLCYLGHNDPSVAFEAVSTQNLPTAPVPDNNYVEAHMFEGKLYPPMPRPTRDINAIPTSMTLRYAEWLKQSSLHYYFAYNLSYTPALDTCGMFVVHVNGSHADFYGPYDVPQGRLTLEPTFEPIVEPLITFGEARSIPIVNEPGFYYVVKIMPNHNVLIDGPYNTPDKPMSFKVTHVIDNYSIFYIAYRYYMSNLWKLFLGPKGTRYDLP